MPSTQPPPPRARPRSGLRRVQPRSRARRPSARRLKFSLISFKFSLIYVLRRVLHRATKRATIYFNFRLFNVLCRALVARRFVLNLVQVAYVVVRFIVRRFTLFDI